MSDYGMLREQFRVTAGRIAPQYINTPAIGYVPPLAVGSVLSCTTGDWVGNPTSFAYAWKRDVSTAIGTNAATYTTVAGDSTHSITCQVSATNVNGTGVATSGNALTIP